MTTHARGGVFLDPEARAVVDIGALNGRAISSTSAARC
jgi:benzoyl-CoA reductase subunit D